MLLLLYTMKCVVTLVGNLRAYTDVLQDSDVLLEIQFYEHAISHVSVIPFFNSTIFSDFFSNRNSLQGILFALVEWLMLSESALLINTYGSSFAVEAAHVSTAAIILLPLLLLLMHIISISFHLTYLCPRYSPIHYVSLHSIQGTSDTSCEYLGRCELTS